MNQPEGQTTGGNHTLFEVIEGTGGNYIPPPNIDTTGGPGGGGGNPLVERIIALETDVKSINTNVGHIKSDISNIWITIIGGLVGVFAIILMLYGYIDYKTEGINDKADKMSEKISTLHIEVTTEFSTIKNDIKNITSQNQKVIDDIGNLTTALNKVVGLNPIVKPNDKP